MARYLPHGTAGDETFDLVVTPESAGWGFSGLRTLTLEAGRPVEITTGELEVIVLPLEGGVRVEAEGQSHHLVGRRDVFTAVTDFVYLPRDTTATLTADGPALIALPAAKATRRLPIRYVPASAVPVELRGAGQASRQVNNFATPGVFETDKLIACEVFTPAGNWSSYPPHKHDETGEHESELEEIYYYRFRSQAPGRVSGAGAGYQRVYGTTDRPADLLEEVADGDVVLIPHGWHGPSVAAPGHDMYYLNVMAGPEQDRAWKIVDDPDHGWIRETWAAQQIDPRLPFHTAPEGVQA